MVRPTDVGQHPRKAKVFGTTYGLVMERSGIRHSFWLSGVGFVGLRSIRGGVEPWRKDPPF